MKKWISLCVVLSVMINQALCAFAIGEEISPEAGYLENSWRYINGERIEVDEEDENIADDAGISLFSATAHGIDVSKHNGTINWGSVKNEVDFAIIRCGYGQDYSSQDDPQWYNNVNGCKNNGIPCGVYLYSYATSTAAAKSEAEHVLRLVRGYNFELPIYYDMEDSKQSGCSAAQLGAIAKTFCDTITNAGYSVGVYANKYWWTSKLTNSVFNNSNWSKWVAQYNSTCTYTGSYDMWQYTSSGRVSGISGNVDKNYLYKSIIPTPSEPLSISNVRYTNFDDGGFNILCNVTGANRVKFPTWTTGDQSDIIWEDCEFDGTTANCRINASAYNGKQGRYITHIYAYNSAGQEVSVEAGNVIWPDKSGPEISNVKISDVSPDGYTISCNISDANAIRQISGATWNDTIGREPEYGGTSEGKTIWYDGVINGNTATIRVSCTDYGGRIGAYTTHIWAWDIAGNSSSTAAHAEIPGIDMKPQKTIASGNHVYSIFDLTLSWTRADDLAKNKGGHLVTVSGDQEQRIVNTLLEYGGKAQYWMGATDIEKEGQWRWINGESWSYSNWHPGEPNNFNGVEHYLGAYSNGNWNDFQDEHSDFGYIMETEINGIPTAWAEKDGHYYYLYDDEVDWYVAKAFCEAMGGHLVTITDSEEQELIQNLALKGDSEYPHYYIGATDKKDGSTWEWVTGEEFSYNNWNSGEPNNMNNIEYYAEIVKSSGKWNDRNSFNDSGKNGFICEIEKDDTYTAKEEYNGNTYLRIDKSLSWEDAKEYCELLGGHLATIADEDEQEVIENLLSRGVDTLRTSYSLGGTDKDKEGTWKWITDEPFDYENWNAGEPNNGGSHVYGEQNYLAVYSNSSRFGLWDDNWNFNSDPYDVGFICEIEGKPEPIPDPEPEPDPIIETPKPEPNPDPDPDPIPELSTVTIGTVNARGGESITIPVKITNNQGICESKFVVKYDNTRLTPEQVAVGENFKEGSITTNIESLNADSNSLTVTWENNSIADNTNNGDMFSITFDVTENAAPGLVPITVDKGAFKVINANGNEININIESGGAAIAWPIISVGSEKAYIGDTVTVPVTIENNTGINAFGFTIAYDNKIMTPVEVTAGDITEGKGSMQSNLQDESIDWTQQSEVTASWLSDDLINNILIPQNSQDICQSDKRIAPPITSTQSKFNLSDMNCQMTRNHD